MGDHKGSPLHLFSPLNFLEMKKIILFSLGGLFLLSFAIFGFKADKPIIEATKSSSIETAPIKPVIANKIQWYTLEEAMKANEKNPKKLFIDFYTDWCGWCKVMDNKTFKDAQVINFMNENFYAVKFNAEQKEALTFKGKEYKFLQGGKRGIHSFAYETLDRSASYPSFVVLDEKLNKHAIIKGFKKPEQFLQLMEAQISM